MSRTKKLLTNKREDGMSKKVKLSALLAGAVIAPWLLTVTGLPSAAQPQESSAKDEVFGVTSVINLPSGQKLSAFDISFVDPGAALYLLADRTNKSIDIADTNSNKVIAQFTPGFQGAVPFTAAECAAMTPPKAFPCGTNNDVSGPDGVLVANGNQIWAGDGMSQVWVLELITGTVLAGPISTALNGPGTDPTRADELCHDPHNKIIMIANDASKPSPFVTFISSDTSTLGTVKGHIVMDGSMGTPNATGGIEQCQWSPKTGKFYLNVPNAQGHENDGVVLRIDPVSEKIEKTFSLKGSGCNGNAGMALGPFPQALLGCSNKGPNSVVININTGAVVKKLPGEAGADQVWYNLGDNQYFLGNGNHLTAVGGTAAPTLGVVDATGGREDFSPTSAVGSHSVAADPVKNQVYVPINSAATGICTPHGGTDANGCIAVFTVTSGKDDKAKCVAQGEPVIGMNDGEPEVLKTNCPD